MNNGESIGGRAVLIMNPKTIFLRNLRDIISRWESSGACRRFGAACSAIGLLFALAILPCAARAAGALPVIASFEANPSTINLGDAVALTWEVTGATALKIDPGVGVVTGTAIAVKPTDATTYILTATNAAGSSTAKVTITLLPPPPVISYFGAAPDTINAGQSTSLRWTVGGAKSLSIDHGVGVVEGTSCQVTPTRTLLYILTATNASGSCTAQVIVTVVPPEGSTSHHVIAYNSALQGSWVRSCRETSPIYTDFAAMAPGLSGKAIEVRFGAANGRNAFGLADRKSGWDPQYKYLNEFRTIEFDFYVEADSTGIDNLVFMLEDAGYSDDLQLTDLIPGWSNLAAAQRVNRWFHVTVALQAIHVTIPRFHQILIFNRGDGAVSQPHFRMANVELGWVDGLTPPAVALQSATPNPSCDQLALTFTTGEATRYRIEYGIGNYGQVFQGPADEWSSTHTVALTGLHPGSNYQYRIVALDHRTDPTAAPNQGAYAGTYAMPATPITPPPISGLVVSQGER